MYLLDLAECRCREIREACTRSGAGNLRQSICDIFRLPAFHPGKTFCRRHLAENKRGSEQIWWTQKLKCKVNFDSQLMSALMLARMLDVKENKDPLLWTFKVKQDSLGDLFWIFLQSAGFGEVVGGVKSVGWFFTLLMLGKNERHFVRSASAA